MPAAVGRKKARSGRRWQQQRNKSRGKPRPTYCPLCGIATEDSVAFDIHLEDLRHKWNYMLAWFKENRNRMVKNRHGVEVNVHCRGNKINSTSDGTVKSIIDPETTELVYEFQVVNNGSRNNKPPVLIRIMLLHPYEAFSIADEFNISSGADKEARLHPGGVYVVKVTFSNCGIGTYGVPVSFTFERDTDSPKNTFHIIRMMVVNVIGPDHTVGPMELHKDSPFTGERWLNMEVTVPGHMPDGRRIKRLLEYSIPEDLMIIFQQDLLPWDGIDYDMTCLLYRVLTICNVDCDPNKDNYAEYFHTLLYLDEYEAMQNIQKYNMADVPIEIVSDTRLQLEVPGLAERRPSVLKGDLIYLRVCLGENSVERIQYEGVIAEVRETCVVIGGFDPELMARLEEDPRLHFDVHFSFNRFSMFIMHRAIDLLVKEDKFDVVFPPDHEFPPLRTKGPLEFINPLIQNNPEQQRAVRNILLGTSRPAPYIIFGPPGTGKTMTVVEAILQVKNKIRGSYILVCAPANAACDLLAQRLSTHCTTDELLRLHSSSRDWDTVPEDIYSYSNHSEGLYYFPKETKLHSYRIIVCTLMNSGRMLPKINKDDDFYDYTHFTHVFIDECGQALEPGALVPVAGILGGARKNLPGGQIILAGDPMQLGPVCGSKKGEEAGLGLSLMERLMTKWELYMRDDSEEESYNYRFITKLCRNFRSHELIVALPNELFYNKELKVSCGQDVTNDRVKNLKNDPQCDHAVVFHGVLGHEKREGRSPSYFNLFELEIVVRYVADLVRGGPSRDPVPQNNIGIIAPYIRQVYRLKAKLKEKGWENVEVGTTETFQGREKRVILISTVRSNRNLLDYDRMYQLGFVADAKRFNVAITRARSLLIIVGNPHLLETDVNWRKLINFSLELKSYRGCKFSRRYDSEWKDTVMRNLKLLNGD